MGINDLISNLDVRIPTDRGGPEAKLNALHPYLSLYPRKIRECLQSIPDDQLLWDEKKIIRHAYTDNRVPPMERRIRLSFWAEYDRCVVRGIRMEEKRILAGICSPYFFNEHYCPHNKIIQLITTEPYEQKKSMIYVHHLCVSEMEKMISEETDTNSKNGPSMWANKIRVFEWLDQRINGPLPQHIVSKNVNVNVEATAPQSTLPQSPEELDARLKELMHQLEGGNSHQPQIQIQSPLEKVHIEAGRVVDAEFIREDKRRDNSHKELE